MIRRTAVGALLLLSLVGACAQPPAPRPAVVVEAATLAPLGPCPASSWRPEAPPPTSSWKVSMVLLAVQEWFRFGQQTIDFTSGSPRLVALGVQEREAPERVRDYWKSVDRPQLSGLDSDVPWSAAFVSWDVQSAGVPRDLFCPDARHTIYVERIVQREKLPGAAFIAHHLSERAPMVGDLLCASRAGGGTSLENLNRGPGHCDIVVDVQPGRLEAIGGNVHDSVSRSIFPLDANGFMSPIAERPFFAVIENRLP